ncbi:MAG TPA: cation diffusion facilitator family transporter [Alphaproteobacteria bacterium]|nr:cation diffusion facilitator family transporter [Alphaproteobacteria bacterium]
MTPSRHSHHDHGHAHGHFRPDADASNEKRLLWVLVLTGAFMAVEVAGGLISGSLALLADAGHMLADTAALGLSWLAFRAGRRPANLARSYGHHRFQVLAAFLNGLALLAIVGWIIDEAVQRLLAPAPIMATAMLVTACAGLAANALSFAILHGGDRRNLNMKGAILHVLGDLLGSLGAIAAALVIMVTGWTPIDPILSVVMSLLILRSAWALVRQSWHVLMEGAPEGLDVTAMSAELESRVPGLIGVHHVHAWSLTGERPLVTLHAHIGEGTDHDSVRHAIHRILVERFGISHATIQVERGACGDPKRSASAPKGSCP